MMLQWKINFWHKKDTCRLWRHMHWLHSRKKYAQRQTNKIWQKYTNDKNTIFFWQFFFVDYKIEDADHKYEMLIFLGKSIVFSIFSNVHFFMEDNCMTSIISQLGFLVKRYRKIPKHNIFGQNYIVERHQGSGSFILKKYHRRDTKDLFLIDFIYYFRDITLPNQGPLYYISLGVETTLLSKEWQKHNIF